MNSENLLSIDELERSGVVANCHMNRERTLTGMNGYTREVGFNPFDRMKELVAVNGCCSWLDLCCGSGRALIEAAQLAQAEGYGDKIKIVGVDLVDAFADSGHVPGCLRFVAASLSTWALPQMFDIITCVHGLHYVGDKLRLIARARGGLTHDGEFAATFDLENIKQTDGRLANRFLLAEFRRNGIEYDRRRKRLTATGNKVTGWRFEYVGADDTASPNFSGQPAVDSYYRRI